MFTKRSPILNNQKFYVFDRSGIPTCRHFTQGKHRFNKHAEFTLTESIKITNKPKYIIQEL